MNETAVERRLAAIMAADVVGYSRLMGGDEVGTLRALRTHRSELIDPTIASRRGRIVKTTGDGLLAEFPSAVEAVACAITIQRGLASRNTSTAEEKRLTFRIGINIGDIIIEANDIFGDGVNVAARLETLCEPGGVCISRAVRDQVRDKMPVAFDDLGEQQVKNIARPVRAFGLGPNAIAAAPDLPQSAGIAATRHGHAGMFAAFIVALSIAGAGCAWWLLAAPTIISRQAEDVAAPAAPVAPARASIAVLPFTSLTADGDSDYFADGLTEDIISALGRFRELSVIARAAVFGYKGKSPTPVEVGRDLKVRYVVDGSIRRAPERFRVSVSLTDTTRSAVLWSEKYDVEPKDIFSVEDQITRRISGALAVRVSSLELARSVAKPPNNVEAYDLVLRGRDLLGRLTRSNNLEARRLFERAIEIDPTYAPAYVGLGRVNRFSAIEGWAQEPIGALERAASLARKAIELDDLNAGAQALLGQLLVQFGEYERALDALKRAIDLNGSDPEAYRGLAAVLLWRGDTQGAIAAGEALGRFQPDLSAPDAFHLAMAYVLADRDADAIRILRQSLDRDSTDPNTNIMLAAAYAQAGNQPEAERQSVSVRNRFPLFSRERFGTLLREASQREKLSAMLKKAGL
jgi:class 3 adenylate cyclase/TolB-like protein/cytochrome c-type biogenesis protein CcmH/NrfG